MSDSLTRSPYCHCYNYFPSTYIHILEVDSAELRLSKTLKCSSFLLAIYFEQRERGGFGFSSRREGGIFCFACSFSFSPAPSSSSYLCKSYAGSICSWREGAERDSFFSVASSKHLCFTLRTTTVVPSTSSSKIVWDEQRPTYFFACRKML